MQLLDSLGAFKVSHPSFTTRFSVDAVIAALVATDLKPNAALGVLFGEPWVRRETEEEDSTCCVA